VVYTATEFDGRSSIEHQATLPEYDTPYDFQLIKSYTNMGDVTSSTLTLRTLAYDPDLVYYWDFTEGSVTDKIRGTDLVSGSAFTFAEHPITGNQALVSRSRVGLPNGVDPLFPTSNFSIRAKLYYVQPPDGTTYPTMDIGINFDYYALRITSESSNINPAGNIKVYFNSGNQRLYAYVRLNNGNGNFVTYPTPEWGLNQTGFKNIVINVDTNVLYVYVNGFQVIRNAKHQTVGIDFEPGLNTNTNTSPLIEHRGAVLVSILRVRARSAVQFQ
jgi:hypothetical protein